MTHSKTPWEARYMKENAKIISSDGHGKIATVHVRYTKMNNLEEFSANAEFIVRACNAYDDMLAFAEYYLDSESTTKKCDAMAKEIIKKARGE
jgi:hypothetical protein